MSKSATTEQAAKKEPKVRRFQFYKGKEEIFGRVSDDDFDWKQSASKTREQLGNAMNSRHLSFLFGSGCSTFYKEGTEVGIPTMAPLAKDFLATGKKKPDEVVLN